MPNTELLKQRLSEIGMTQTQLAEAIAIAVPTMSQKINNLRPFSLDEAEKVAAILKIKDKDFGRFFFDTHLRSANCDDG
jgi:Plasmid maintenance system antidote protein